MDRPSNVKRSAILKPSLTILCVIFVSIVCTAQPAERAVDRERIHFGDVVDVDVVGSFDLDWRGGLNPEGFLDGVERLEKPVFALCRTESEVAAQIREQYASFLRDPNIVVRVIDRTNRALAYVNGAVRKPQRLQLRRPLRLAELIVIAGGLTESSSGEISIFRPANTNCTSQVSSGPLQAPTRISIKISDIIGGAAESNPPILSGDIVSVVEAPPVFLTGDIASRRRMNLTPDLTLSRAITAAGGIPKEADGRRVRIYRRQGTSNVLEFDMRAIRDKKAEDPKLEPYDVIDVVQKGGSPKTLASFPDEDYRGKATLAKLPLRIVD